MTKTTDTPSYTIGTPHGWFCDVCGDTVGVHDWRTVQMRHCDQCNMDRPVEPFDIEGKEHDGS